jgi:hypothetical protein
MRSLLIPLLAFALTALPGAAGAQLKIPQVLEGVMGKSKPSPSQGGSETGPSGSALSTADITAGLRDALKVGTERVVGLIGKTDGYNADPDIHIPLPSQLQTVQSTLKRFGMSSLADDLELKLNRAAEAAAPKTKQIIWDAITKMTVDDARAIYNGPEDAATQYFQRTSTGDLKAVVRPVVDNALSEVGAIAAYDKMISQYKSLPLVPDVKANLSDHTVDYALKGLFHYLAKEEAAIRQNPAKRTTDILAKVFGS